MIWLNGIQIADPSALGIDIRRIFRGERTSSGRMVRDEIAIKRAISLEYRLIAGTELEAILINLESRVFHTLRYPDSQGVERTVIVSTEDIVKSAWLAAGGERFWRNVKIGLIEQ